MAISSTKIWHKSITLIFICMFALLALSACKETPIKSEDNTGSEKTVVSESSESQSTEVEDNEVKSELTMKINEETVSVEWEDNESVSALRELAIESPITIQASMYGGFELVGSIGRSLPRNDERITTGAGDIVLYSGNDFDRSSRKRQCNDFDQCKSLIDSPDHFDTHIHRKIEKIPFVRIMGMNFTDGFLLSVS